MCEKEEKEGVLGCKTITIANPNNDICQTDIRDNTLVLTVECCLVPAGPFLVVLQGY